MLPLIDFVPPSSRVREDMQELTRMGPFKRPLNLPVEIPRPAWKPRLTPAITWLRGRLVVAAYARDPVPGTD